MKKFRFELQGVLNVKEKLEGQAKMNFGSAMSKYNAEEAKLQAIDDRRREYRDRLEAMMNGDLDIRDIGHCRDGIDVLTEQYEAQEAVVRRAEKQVEVCRTRLNTAMRERKTIEKLREKRFTEYIGEYNAEESKAIDELVSYRHSAVGETQDAARGEM